jgi:hypothetical protein
MIFQPELREPSSYCQFDLREWLRSRHSAQHDAQKIIFNFVVDGSIETVFPVFVVTIALPKRKPGPKPEFPGLTEDSAALGVSRYFLWQVLKGSATSAPLLARYRALRSAKPTSTNHKSTL